uniref:non-specific serine/threonine protein kinase n=1 Tax=Oreochromis niloticus TaxID=8128 RepID=A0A669EG96_ORENI
MCKLRRCQLSYIQLMTTPCLFCLSVEDFEEKYEEQDVLGEGQFGKVFCGKRREDNFQVVIKHVSQKSLDRQPMLLNGEKTKIPMEVALLIKVGAGPEATSSNVTPVLLDWYDLEKELVMVFEGSKNNIDLEVYLLKRREMICESDIKAIMRQLVDAATEMHSKEAVTRRNGRKSPALNLPFNATKADCITVLQLGRVMDRLLHNIFQVTSANKVSLKRTDISENCESFLLGCLADSHEDRLTLEELQNHPWFK